MVVPALLQAARCGADDGSNGETCGHVAQNKHNDQDDGDQDHSACVL